MLSLKSLSVDFNLNALNTLVFIFFINQEFLNLFKEKSLSLDKNLTARLFLSHKVLPLTLLSIFY